MLLHGDDPARLLPATEDEIFVQRLDGVHLDHARPYPFASQDVGCLQRPRQRHSAGDVGQVVPVAQHEALADLRLVAVCKDLWHLVPAQTHVDRPGPVHDLRQEACHRQAVGGNHQGHVRQAAQDREIGD